MKKTICFYHSADLDGHCSGAIVAHKHPEAELRGINYGHAFPWDAVPGDALVYVVDFCLQPFSDMLRLHRHLVAGGGRLVWIDHHKSAIRDYARAPEYDGAFGTVRPIEGMRNMELAGCELTWKYLFPAFPVEPLPWAVELIGRHDVWDHRNPDVEPFQYGMRLYETVPERKASMWSMLLSGGRPAVAFVMQALDDGRKIMAYQKQQDAIYAAGCSFRTELDGVRLLACNRDMANSKLFDSVWPKAKKECDAMCLFAWRRDHWEVKLFTDHQSMDVSLIAKARGGGGHQNAAGFQCRELPFDGMKGGCHADCR